MFALFRYLALRIRNPTRKDFLYEGFGIEARAKRSRKFWQHHLKNCRNFILQAAPPEKSSYLILGAGTLLDIPFDELLPNASSITLVDANPGAVLALKSAQARGARSGVPTVILTLDVTGRIDDFTERLRSWRASAADGIIPASISSSLLLSPTRFPALLKPHDVVVSANLLSQIGVMWRERVSSTTKLDDAALTDFNRDTSRLLEEEHLHLLSLLSNKKIVLLSDRLFMFYRKDSAKFQCEPALHIETPAEFLPDFERIRGDSWFWHLAPQGIEEKNYGTIHDVFAEEYRKKR